MNRRSLRSLSLLFIVLAVFARQSTGAPNVQVSFSEVSKIHSSSLTNSLLPAGPNLHNVDTGSNSDLLSGSKKHSDFTSLEKHYKNYKKYVSPDRSFELRFEISKSTREILVRAPTEKWALSSLPQVQRSHAPPVNDVSFSHIGTSLFEGVFRGVSFCSFIEQIALPPSVKL